MTNRMPKVTADSEEVIFDGEVPGQPARIYELIMSALSEQGRAVVQFLVDGEDALQAGEFPESFEEIEAFSLSHDELTLRLIIESMKQLGEVEEQFDAYVKNILSVSWSDVFSRMDQFIAKIQPFADLLDNLTPYAKTYDPPWRSALESISEDQADSLGKILTSFEQGNPSLLSDELSINFIPIFKRTRKLFKEEVIPFLEERASQDKVA